MIQQSGLLRVLQLLDTDLKAVALGNGAVPGYLSTQMPSEYYRNLVTGSFYDGLTLIKELYLDETQGNGTIAAIGILGDGATTTPGTGKLFASSAANIAKTSTQSLTLSFEITTMEVPA